MTPSDPDDFVNVYEDPRRAEAYARLDWPGTYSLAWRGLRHVIPAHATGRRALDFGCGAGRSTRLLRELGFDAVGVDISADMLRQARALDPAGDYRQLDGGALRLPEGCYDLVLSSFTFDNIPLRETKVQFLTALGRSLASAGRLVNLVSAPEIYVNEWVSFTTKDYPENRRARSGDRVRIVMTDVEDRRPVEDVVWGDEDYQDVYREASLTLVEAHRPLAREDEGIAWVSETRIAPWVLYVLRRTQDTERR